MTDADGSRNFVTRQPDYSQPLPPARPAAPRYSFKTEDGTIWLDMDAGRISMGPQGGAVAGASATVDTAGAIEKRITATRIVLTGVFALAWRKKKDNRELYLLVEGTDFSMVAQVKPDRAAEARKFAGGHHHRRARRDGALLGAVGIVAQLRCSIRT